MDNRAKILLKIKVGQVFKPGTPINKFDLFAGRQRQINDIIDAINHTGQHIVIFGERGVGKTSLSKVLVELLTGAGIDVISPENINCDSTDDFAKIWLKVFRELYALFRVRNKEAPTEITLDEEELYYETPDDVRYVLGQLTKPAIIVLDEVDRITDSQTTTLLADTIKNLSDHATPSTLILIGIADSIDELIKEHRSVERALIQVHLPRMSFKELYEIIEKGSKETDIHFDQNVANYIVKLSSGLPHYTHTLALYAAEYAITNDRTTITMDDVEAAIRRTVENPGSLLSAYEKAVASSRKTLYAEVLLACALAEKSDLGYFAAGSIRTPLENITGKRYEIPAFSAHLEAFCSEDRGMVLQKSGRPRQFRFRFVNPLLQPFVTIHGLSKGLIDKSALIANSDPDPESEQTSLDI
jgi:Cdc6-like AAA superfamily ATPase